MNTELTVAPLPSRVQVEVVDSIVFYNGTEVEHASMAFRDFCVAEPLIGYLTIGLPDTEQCTDSILEAMHDPVEAQNLHLTLVHTKEGTPKSYCTHMLAAHAGLYPQERVHFAHHGHLAGYGHLPMYELDCLLAGYLGAVILREGAEPKEVVNSTLHHHIVHDVVIDGDGSFVGVRALSGDVIKEGFQRGEKLFLAENPDTIEDRCISFRRMVVGDNVHKVFRSFWREL